MVWDTIRPIGNIKKRQKECIEGKRDIHNTNRQWIVTIDTPRDMYNPRDPCLPTAPQTTTWDEAIPISSTPGIPQPGLWSLIDEVDSEHLYRPSESVCIPERMEVYMELYKQAIRHPLRQSEVLCQYIHMIGNLGKSILCYFPGDPSRTCRIVLSELYRTKQKMIRNLSAIRQPLQHQQHTILILGRLNDHHIRMNQTRQTWQNILKDPRNHTI